MQLSKKTKDLRGRRFGRLTVAEYLGWCEGKKAILWRGVCDCGGEKITVSGELTRKSRPGLRSCGCLQPEVASDTHSTHRMSKTPEYQCWQDMKSRCGNPSDAEYGRYGARGITVCAKWRESFESFLTDVGQRPADHLSLDRKDVNGNYEPGNVHWTTASRQQRNRRDSRKVLFRGVETTQADLAEACGLTRHQVRGRIRAGWSEDEIVGLRPR